MKPLPSSTSRNAASSRGISGSYSARTSTRGIVCTRGHFSHSDPAIHEIRQRRENPYDDRVLDVAEIVLEALVARSQGIADADEGERPERRPDQGQAEEDSEWHLEDPGRDRDERANHGRHRPDEYAGPVPPLEPRVGAVEPLRGHVEPAAVPLEQLPPAVTSDQPADERAYEVAERRREHDDEVRAGAV